ncbi:MAG: arginine-tRNA-protein transferase [Bacteroidota bacterium]
MFTEIHYPEKMSPDELDAYLDRAWFRMGQMIFTCRFLCFGGALYSAIWTRLDLRNYQFRKSLRKLIKRNNKQFRVLVRRAVFNDEKEMLYQDHKARFEGYIAETLKESLHGEANYNIYDTWEVCVYDKNRLVAVSFFDIGGNSLASIMGLFDPAYSKHSLGFYTMLLEIMVGHQNNKAFYYPGYVVPGYQRFDYKLRIGPVDFYNNKNNQWEPYEQLVFDETPSEDMKHQLQQFQKVLEKAGIPNKLVLYPLYDKELYGFERIRFVRYPLFVSCRHSRSHKNLLIVTFDLDEREYRLSLAKKIDDALSYLTYILFEGYEDNESYLEFLEHKELLLKTADLELLLTAAKKYLKRVK